MPVSVVIQSPDAGAIVELFEVDLTNLGASVYRFTSSINGEQTLMWDNNSFTPVPLEADGFEWNSSGSLPQPKIKFSNIGGLFSSLIISTQDLVGGYVTRYVTFRRFLDDGEEPDPTAYLLKDVFKIERKSSQNPIYVEFELSAASDQEGRMLPNRQILKDGCTHLYRYWDSVAGNFNYSLATCPYAGTNYFNTSGASVSANSDKCGKTLTDCRLRFGLATELPFRGFPGAGRIR